jgi:hypothetical protein
LDPNKTFEYMTESYHLYISVLSIPKETLQLNRAIRSLARVLWDGGLLISLRGLADSYLVCINTIICQPTFTGQ